ncbi:hypothetical protein V6N13_069228 [Hibiscus sabdariffa]
MSNPSLPTPTLLDIPPPASFSSSDSSSSAIVSTTNVPKDRHGKISTGYLHVVLDAVAPSTGLPPIVAVEQIDKIVADVFSTTHADDKKTVKEDEFKKLLTEILWTIMLQLEDNPITVSSSSVVHEPLESSSSILQP